MAGARAQTSAPRRVHPQQRPRVDAARAARSAASSAVFALCAAELPTFQPAIFSSVAELVQHVMWCTRAELAE